LASPQAACISCQTVAGDYQPPGGILYEDNCWVLFLSARPSLVAGQGFIVLKRHCENVADLTPEEQATLGVMMAKTAEVMSRTLHAEKVHFGLYGEGVKHIHLHVTPRTAALPGGNIPMTYLSVWRDVLEKLRLRQPISDAAVATAAAQLKTAFEQSEGVSRW
jgi:diadenosine tetraphosphate (Ap4A) HIT family hydrolase